MKKILILCILVCPLLFAGKPPDEMQEWEARMGVSIMDVQLKNGKLLIGKWRYDPITGHRPQLPYREVYAAVGGRIQLERIITGEVVNGSPTFK